MPRVPLLFWRALRLHCPNCGGGPLFEAWLKPKQRCPVCRLRLERGEEGYQVGSYMFNIIAAELIFAALFLGIVLLTWPSPPWRELQIGGILLMIVAPFIFFPFSKTLFLAFDLVFRPPTSEELGKWS